MRASLGRFWNVRDASAYKSGVRRLAPLKKRWKMAAERRGVKRGAVDEFLDEEKRKIVKSQSATRLELARAINRKDQCYHNMIKAKERLERPWRSFAKTSVRMRRRVRRRCALKSSLRKMQWKRVSLYD